MPQYCHTQSVKTFNSSRILLTQSYDRIRIRANAYKEQFLPVCFNKSFLRTRGHYSLVSYKLSDPSTNLKRQNATLSLGVMQLPCDASSGVSRIGIETRIIIEPSHRGVPHSISGICRDVKLQVTLRKIPYANLNLITKAQNFT